MADSKNQKTNQQLRLSPLIRFGFEFSNHLRFVGHREFDKGFAERLSQQIQNLEAKMQRQLRHLMRWSGVLLILLVTRKQDITVFGFPIVSLSFATEALMLACSYAFFFLMTTFTASQGYKTLLNNWCLSLDPADPDYLKSSYFSDELLLKIFKPKTTHYSQIRSDFYISNLPFKFASYLTWFVILVVVFAMLLLHLLIQTVAGVYVFETHNLGIPLTKFILFTCFAFHVSAISIGVLSFVPFTFDVAEKPFNTH